MVEINNQRKAFLDMLAWSEELITDVENQKSWLWRHCRPKLFTDYSDHPRKLVTLNPKLKSTGAGRYQLLSRWWDAYRKQLGLKDFSPKSQDAVALQQLTMIDRGDIRQAIDRCSNIWASLPGAGYGQFEHKADSLIAKFKEAGGTVREIDVWAESPRLSPLWLSASSSACHGLLIITVITPYLQEAQRDKNARELKLANAAITDMQMRQRDVAALDAKYTKGLMLSWKWCSAWWCCRWSSSVAHQKQSVDQCVATTASGVDNKPPPTGRHRWTGLFHPQREADHYAKTTGRNPEYINEQCR